MLTEVNDIAVITAINAIKKYGLNVSGDISILGFDDIKLVNKTTPKLSSIITCHNLLEGSHYPLYLYWNN